MKGIQIEAVADANHYDVVVGVERDARGLIVSGLSIGRTDEQNMALLLELSQGALKAYPTLGIGLRDMLHEHNMLEWQQRIKQQFDDEGIIIDQLKLSATDGLDLKAHYR